MKREIRENIIASSAKSEEILKKYTNSLQHITKPLLVFKIYFDAFQPKYNTFANDLSSQALGEIELMCRTILENSVNFKLKPQ